jgi:hypothetical protein
MNVEILKNVTLVLLGLSVIWLIRVLVKKETQNLGRAVLVCVLFGAVSFYLQHVKLQRLTFNDIRMQIKSTLFPEKPPNYVYQKEEGNDGKRGYIHYFFESPGPKLSLEMDAAHKYFAIKDVHSVNRILEYLGLPLVDHPVRELAAITGSANDLNTYKWEDYQLGVLTVVRDICQDRDKLESYQCIESIFISKK